MPRKKSPNLTEAELKLMQVLWKLGCATVSGVVEGLPKDVPLAYSTVLTTLRILENKGHVRHTKKGRAFIYHPIMGREQARENAVTHLVRSFFGNSRELLVLNLLGAKRMDPAELKRLRKLIEEQPS